MTVTIPDDFDLQKIAASGQAFRIAQTPQGWRFLAGDKLLYLQPGSGDTYTASCTPEEWQGFWHRYFDLNRNYAAHPRRGAQTGCLPLRSGPGRGGHPHSAPGRLGDAGYLYHQPAQKYPGHSGLRGNAVYPVRCAATAAGRECAVCVPNGAGARRGRGAGIAGLRAGLPRPVCSGCRPGSCSGSAGPCRAGNPARCPAAGSFDAAARRGHQGGQLRSPCLPMAAWSVPPWMCGSSV